MVHKFFNQILLEKGQRTNVLFCRINLCNLNFKKKFYLNFQFLRKVFCNFHGKKLVNELSLHFITNLICTKGGNIIQLFFKSYRGKNILRLRTNKQTDSCQMIK